MFDTIECNYLLPIPDPIKKYGCKFFQTKDFDNALHHYEIRDDGTFWKEEKEVEYVPGDKKGKTFSEQFGFFKTLNSWWVRLNTTATVNMYTYIVGDDDYDYSIDYEVILINGKVEKITIEKFESISNITRKKIEHDFELSYEKRKEFEDKWYYKYILKYYNIIVKKIFILLRYISNKITCNLWKIEDNLTF